jgi:hypothetical protein
MSGPDVPEILLFYVDAGGGHRNAARALSAAVEKSNRPWRFRMVNIEGILSRLDWLRRLSGVTIEEFYNLLLRRQWTGVMIVPLLRLLQLMIRLRRARVILTLTRFLREQSSKPRGVVSVLPNFNGLLQQSCRAALPGAPFTVVLTDLADLPPRFWIEQGLERVVVGTDEAADQARRIGLPASAIRRVSGMVLHPRFHETPAAARRGPARQDLGLIGDEPLIRGLLRESPDWHVLAVCGENPSLAETMSRLACEHSTRLHVLGFTDRLADFMAAADLLVTKPGPGSLSEALHQRLAVVVAANRKTLPQERFNVRWIRKHGLGLVVPRWDDVPRAAAEYFGDSRLRARIRERIAALPENRAVFEILDVIEDSFHGIRGSDGNITSDD